MILDSAKRMPIDSAPSTIRGEALKLYSRAKSEGLLKPGTKLPEFRKRYENAFKRLNP